MNEELKKLALQIKNATLPAENTAERVGTALLAIIEAVGVDELGRFFLRKDITDTAKETITFEKGLVAKSPITANEIGSVLSDSLKEDIETAEITESVNMLSDSLKEDSVSSDLDHSLGSMDNVDHLVDEAPDGSIMSPVNKQWKVIPGFLYGLLHHRTITLTDYEALAQKDENTLYFCMEDGKITCTYLGEIPFAGGSGVAGFPFVLPFRL